MQKRDSILTFQRSASSLNMKGAVEVARELLGVAQLYKDIGSCVGGEGKLSIQTKDTVFNFAPSAFDHFIPMVKACVRHGEEVVTLWFYLMKGE